MGLKCATNEMNSEESEVVDFPLKIFYAQLKALYVLSTARKARGPYTESFKQPSYLKWTLKVVNFFVPNTSY